MHLTNFIFTRTFFLVTSYQISKNYGLFFQGKDSLQLDRFQFLTINSLMAETIKNQFPKTKFL